VKKDC